MAYSPLTPERVDAAVAQFGTVFFNADLQPVEPKVGQWFCEFDIRETFEGQEVVDGDLVEFVGMNEAHTFGPEGMQTRPSARVVAEGDDGDREPGGVILILQH